MIAGANRYEELLKALCALTYSPRSRFFSGVLFSIVYIGALAFLFWLSWTPIFYEREWWYAVL